MTTLPQAISVGAKPFTVGCIFQAGFKEVPHRGTGIGRIREALVPPLRDRLFCKMMSLEPWNADAKTLAEKIVAYDITLVIHFGYSYGVGEGEFHFAKEMEKVNRHIDLAVIIDGVTRYGILKWRTLRHGGEYRVPPNIRNVASWRTIHKPSFAWDYPIRPVGHGIVVTEHTKLLSDVVFGTADDFEKQGRPDAVCVEQTKEDVLSHRTIDDSPIVRDAVVTLVTDFIRERQSLAAAENAAPSEPMIRAE